MSLVVEDGTGYPNSESYVSVASCALYASNRGLIFDGTQIPLCEQALRRATAYIDQTYRLRFAGYRTNRRAQSLEWPRNLAYYYTPDFQGNSPFFIDARLSYPYDLIPSNSLPPEIINATCEAAIREYAEIGSLFPDLDRGGQVSELDAGPVKIKYSAAAKPTTTFQAIDAALSGLLGMKSAYTAKAARG